ncbi:MAG: AbrB family transcriptional regulator [Cohaesibacter sp.]|nr:AbrB family transcriptional regulator [Cohaesibacter sp.]
MLRLAETLLYAVIGGWIAARLSLPAGWLMGALIGTMAMALMGRSLLVPAKVRDAAFIAVGIVLGSGITPQALSAMQTWPASIAILVVIVLAITSASYWVLRLLGQWDHSTALFASLPGALAYVMVIAEQSKADIPKVAIAQALRVVILVAILPIFFGGGESAAGHSLDNAIAPLGLLPLLGLVLLTVVVGLIANALALPAALLLAGMMVAGIAYASGMLAAPLPQWFQVPGFIVIGAVIGARFSALPFAMLRQMLGLSLLAFGSSALIAGIGAFLCALWLDLPFGQVFLAYAPGGFETMVLMAFLLDMNPAYVAGHHLVRYVGLIILAPIVTRRLTRSDSARK